MKQSHPDKENIHKKNPGAILIKPQNFTILRLIQPAIASLARRGKGSRPGCMGVCLSSRDPSLRSA